MILHMHVCICLFVSVRMCTFHITYVANRGQLVADDSFHFVYPGMEFRVGGQAPLPTEPPSGVISVIQ